MGKVRVDQLTLGELALVERKSGQSISALTDEKAPKMGVMLWLAYVIKKREDPDFTEEQAKNLPMEVVSDLIDTGDSEEDPMSAAQPSG